jgi:crotonobetainyl-CoA:carnitine CoA-transferase CaiB-like acyl-CoA transferase
LGRNIKQVGMPFKLSRTPGQVRSMPLFGEHSETLLRRVGLGDTEIAAYREERVIE